MSDQNEQKEQQNTSDNNSWENARENWERLEEEQARKNWDRWDSDSSHSSYYNQPTHVPYDIGFATASVVCGFLAITAGCCGLALPFGALGVLFALLTYRKGKRMLPNSKLGLTLSILGMAIGVGYLIYILLMIRYNPAFLEQLNQTSQMLYGTDITDMLKDTYGIYSN